MITSRRMAAVDRNAAALGVPTRVLMESSGNAVAHRVRELVDPGDRVELVCGRGNNGGDAFAAARFLEEYDCTVHLLGKPESISTDIARANWDALQNCELDTRVVGDSREFSLSDPDLVVDAMLGTGVTGALRQPEAAVARAINDADAPVLAVDVPSGIDADTGDVGGADTDAEEGIAVDADHVVTFHAMKPGLTDHPDVTVADIGIPEAAERFLGPGDVEILTRGGGGTKGENGRVFVVGGGPYTGAPALAAQAALRAGADLAFVACPESVFEPIAGYAEDLIVQPYSGDHLAPEHVSGLLETAHSHDDVVVIGPGLGRHDDTQKAAKQFLSEFEGTAVVDADALPFVPDVDTEATLVCTPNRKELTELGGPDVDDLTDSLDEIEALATDLGHVVVAKGPQDVVTDGEETRISRAGTPGMTVGGTGDTLAGIIAGLLGSDDPFEAACGGTYVNGRAAELLERGGGLLASDLQETIPTVLWGDADDEGDDE
jgi:hydroxyethylthiazole kinase-like uncharacterized protein yjeF